MPWFRRSPAADADAAAASAPQLQALKRQARNRLIGMLVLILAGIGLFTWVLDGQPRQTEREIVYEIPSRGERLSVRIPAQARQADASSQDPASPAEQVQAAAQTGKLAPASDTDTPAQIRARRRAALAENEEFLDEAPLAAGNDEPVPNKSQLVAEQALKAQAAQKAAADKLAREKAQKTAKEQADKLAREQEQKAQKTEKAEKDKADKAKAEEAARARALLEGKAEPKADHKAESKAENKTEGAEKKSARSVVQFGSFADPAKAAEVRRKVEGAGLKTYTQEIDTPRGKLIRLRVGPFNQAEDADAAAKKIKALGLPASVLTL